MISKWDSKFIFQSRCIDQNNLQKTLTWHISLTDDQDEISERFLGMHLDNKSKEDIKKCCISILTVPKNTRNQVDEIFNPIAEINPNEIVDYVNTKVSWIHPASYQQYIKSIPSNVSIF